MASTKQIWSIAFWYYLFYYLYNLCIYYTHFLCYNSLFVTLVECVIHTIHTHTSTHTQSYTYCITYIRKIVYFNHPSTFVLHSQINTLIHMLIHISTHIHIWEQTSLNRSKRLWRNRSYMHRIIKWQVKSFSLNKDFPISIRYVDFVNRFWGRYDWCTLHQRVYIHTNTIYI